jgi:hypothetical protein
MPCKLPTRELRELGWRFKDGVGISTFVDITSTGFYRIPRYILMRLKSLRLMGGPSGHGYLRIFRAIVHLMCNAWDPLHRAYFNGYALGLI